MYKNSYKAFILSKFSIKFLLSGQPWLSRLLLFTLISNVLMLVPSWYMLEVYDRVIMSRNVTTLCMLALLATVLLAVMELLNKVRQQILYTYSVRYQQQLDQYLFELSFLQGVLTNQPLNPVNYDYLGRIVQFLRSPVLIALLDLPCALIFLVLIYSMSMTLGHVTLLIAMMVALLTWLNERGVHPKLQAANRTVAESQRLLNHVVRNAEVIQAMQMAPAIQSRWQSRHFEYVSHQSAASMLATRFQSMSRLLQQMLGSIMLGLGCLLLLHGDFAMGGSGLIVGSILASRFLSPMVQLIAGWKHIDNAIDALDQLQKLEKAFFRQPSQLALPAPQGQVLVENVTVRISNSDRFILRGIQFGLQAGQRLAIIGPSGSGKTTLARLMAGAMPSDMGVVRLDGAPLFDWDKALVGPYIGYVPQEVELYDGTIAQNIARFCADTDTAHLEHIVELCGLAAFIQSLPEGLNTAVGAEGTTLPGGKRQLMGLARALYTRPKLLVLDEPSSNLDKAGELALRNVLQALRSQGTTLVLVTHQRSYLEFVDTLAVMMAGELRLFGPVQEVMNKLNPPQEIQKHTAEKLK